MTDQLHPLLADPEGGKKEERQTHKTLLGSEVVNDAAGWHYVMVFNRARNKTDTVKDPQGILKECFTQRSLEAWTSDEPAFFDKIQEREIPFEELTRAVWGRITSILQGKSCGFSLGYKPSIDEEKTLLYIKAGDTETVDQLADRVGIHIRITPDAYATEGLECPVLPRTLGQRLGLNKRPPKFAPLYMKYESVRKDQFRKDAKARLASAESQIDNILEKWERSPAEAKREVRRLMRLEDVRSAAFVVIMDGLKFADDRQEDQLVGAAGCMTTKSKPSVQEDQKRTELLHQVFTEMNEIHERTDPDLHLEMAPMSPEQKTSMRKQRWSPPMFPDRKTYEGAALYAELTDLDLHRLMKRRMAQFFDIAALQKYKLVDALFPPHVHKEIVELSKEWASLHPKHIFQWPGTAHNDMVRNYFGEEVAFFFDWFSYQTRSLLWPAIISIFSLTAPLFMSEDRTTALRVVFAFMMVVWVTLLTATYDQTTTTRNLEWGMMGYSDKGMIRSNYDSKLRGSFREFSVRMGHWLLAFVFIGQTIYAAAEISAFRHHARHNPNAKVHWLGIELPNETAAALALYAVTINIKVMNALWGFASPRISAYENWRTDQLLKNSEVTKTFLVKCVVYYYPFYYLAFVRHIVEGVDPEKCLAELRKNLMVFIIVHISTVVAMIGVQIAQTWWSEMQMRRKAQAREAPNAEVEYTYVQAQAIRPAYSGDTDDYMELSIMLGFISMFSVVFPLAAFMALITNLVEMRVLAFRMCRVVRRPVPRGQEGIGAWITVMRLLTYLSCITAVALLIFEMRPMRRWAFKHQLSAFIIAEHTTLLVVFLVGKAVPAKSVSTERILERNELAEARILGADSKPVDAPAGTLRCLMVGADQLTPAKAIS